MLSFFVAEELEPIENRWEWLMHRITPAMERALKKEAYRILLNTVDVQDVMQEVLIKAAMNYYQLKDEAKIFQWLFTITKREAYAHKSKYSLQALWNNARLITGLFDQVEELGEHLISYEDMNRLAQALSELEDDDRKIVMLKSNTNDTLKEIAQKLGINYHTTRSKYQRALSLLRQRMQEGEQNE
jgi:RNA polymerase sigma factor (sigma-70 family)